MDQLRVLLTNQFASLILFIPKDVVVRGDRRRVRPQGVRDGGVVPVAGLLLRFYPLRLLVVLAGPRCFVLRAELAALKALHPRGKARVGFDELDSELVETEALKRLRALHVSLNLVESIGNVVTSRSYRANVKVIIEVRGETLNYSLKSR